MECFGSFRSISASGFGMFSLAQVDQSLFGFDPISMTPPHQAYICFRSRASSLLLVTQLKNLYSAFLLALAAFEYELVQFLTVINFRNLLKHMIFWEYADLAE